MYDGIVKILPRSFYERHPSLVARGLLGKVLVRRLGERTVSGRIVETEAYSSDDPASHAYGGLTRANRALFAEPGRAYIYFTYGIHFCFNVVARRGKPAGGVLIRALEPLEGVDVMAGRRRTKRLRDLASGPGKLTRALGITMRFYGSDLTRRGDLFIADPGDGRRNRVVRTPRIGVRAGRDRLWRFLVEDSPYVSRRVGPPPAAGPRIPARRRFKTAASSARG